MVIVDTLLIAKRSCWDDECHLRLGVRSAWIGSKEWSTQGRVLVHGDWVPDRLRIGWWCLFAIRMQPILGVSRYKAGTTVGFSDR